MALWTPPASGARVAEAPPPGGDAALDRLAALLVEHGHCDARTLERGRRVAAESGQRLDKVLIQLGLVSERGLAEAYAALLGLPLAPPDRYPQDGPLLADRLGARFLRAARAVPVAIAEGDPIDAEGDEAAAPEAKMNAEGRSSAKPSAAKGALGSSRRIMGEGTPEGARLLVAVADPLDAFTPAAVTAATGLPVSLLVGVPIELDAALDRLYPDPAREAASGDGHAGAGPLEDDAERLKDLASEAPVIRLVNQIVARAVETGASDIHVEPFEDRLRVRYRYDGVLHEADAPPAHLAAAITSRVKIMSRLDIAERRLPQDGRIKLAVRGQEVDFRVSTIPSLHGETVVLRVLDRGAVAFDYARLGLSPAVVGKLDAALRLPNGIVLVTGPTGSGKTTTLYTGLLSLNSVERKVVTVEDPIEYQLPGVNQIQVKPGIGLTFAALLRSILRQDPDVIMVGEIRDLETAQIAVQAALTGHLVLSTVHTNSAAATVARLRDMGLEDYLMAAVLRGVLAQRLVRRLCVHCRRVEEAPPELVERFGLDRRLAAACRPSATSLRGIAYGDGVDGPVRLGHPVGCPHCRGTGYRGRQAIAEFLEPDAEVERLIFRRAETAEIERAAVAAGMVTLFDAGLDAVLAGTTTIEEVVRSIRAEV